MPVCAIVEFGIAEDDTTDVTSVAVSSREED